MGPRISLHPSSALLQADGNEATAEDVPLPLPYAVQDGGKCTPLPGVFSLFLTSEWQCDYTSAALSSRLALACCTPVARSPKLASCLHCCCCTLPSCFPKWQRPAKALPAVLQAPRWTSLGSLRSSQTPSRCSWPMSAATNWHMTSNSGEPSQTSTPSKTLCWGLTMTPSCSAPTQMIFMATETTLRCAQLPTSQLLCYLGNGTDCLALSDDSLCVLQLATQRKAAETWEFIEAELERRLQAGAQASTAVQAAKAQPPSKKEWVARPWQSLVSPSRQS